MNNVEVKGKLLHVSVALINPNKSNLAQRSYPYAYSGMAPLYPPPLIRQPGAPGAFVLPAYTNFPAYSPPFAPPPMFSYPSPRSMYYFPDRAPMPYYSHGYNQSFGVQPWQKYVAFVVIAVDLLISNVCSYYSGFEPQYVVQLNQQHVASSQASESSAVPKKAQGNSAPHSPSKSSGDLASEAAEAVEAPKDEAIVQPPTVDDTGD